ncbi:MAG: PAS domain S-box protein [Bryobacterales bacterium]|nr:PAS domain S-box protein [Bryobacterales bacterium]
MNRQSTQSTDLRTRNLKQPLLAICIMGFFILAGFSIFNYTLGKMTHMWINTAMLLLAAGTILAVLCNIKGVGVYRIICIGTGVGLYSLMSLGPHAPYFQLVLPLVMFFFLGSREGLIWSTCFLFGVTALLFAPEFIGSHAYPTEQGARLLSCHLFVMFFGWNQARSHERFGSTLTANNEQLQDEQKQLKDALNRVEATESRFERINLELREKSRLMETVFDIMGEGIVVVNATGQQLFHNPSAERISGKGMTTSQTSQWAEVYGIFYPDRETPVPADQNPLVRAMRGESVDDFEAFVRNEKRPEGVHVSGGARPIRDDETGEVEAAVLIFRDITKQQQTEQQLEQTISELRDRTRLMETVFDNMDEGVAVFDAEGGMLFFNPGAERIIGLGAMESGPDEWSDLYGAFYPDRKTRVPTDQLPLVRALRGETTDGLEIFVRNDRNREGSYVSAKGRFITSDEGAGGTVKAGVVVFSDITEHKKQEVRLQETIDQLRKQAQLMETVFKSVSDGLVVTNKDGKFLFVNPRAEQMVGMGPTDAPSDQWAETYGTFYPDQKTPVPSDDLPLVRAMRGERTDDVELFIRNQERPEGIFISVSGRPLQDDTGTIEGGVIVLRDVTRLKVTETELNQTVQRLQEQSQLMETVFDSMDEGIIVGDLRGRQIFRNHSADRISGTRTEKAGPDEWAKIYGLFKLDKKTYLSLDENPLVRAMRGKSTDDVEVFVRNENKPDGVYVSVTGRPMRDRKTKKVTAGVIVFRDITKAKEDEAQLERTIAELRSQAHAMETVFNSISDGVVVADENGNFTIFNPSAERIVGIGLTESDPDEWTDRYGIFFPDRVTPVPTEELPLVRAIRGEASDEMELFIRNARVREGVYISVSGRPLQDDSGMTKGGVIVLRDVTERMLADEALAQAFAQGKLEIVDTILHNIGNAISSVTIGVGTIREQVTGNELVLRLGALAKAVEAHRDDLIPYLQTDPKGRQVIPFLLALSQDFAQQNEQLQKTVERVEKRVEHIVDIIRTQRSFTSEAMERKDINLQRAVADAVKLLQDSIAKREIRISIDSQNAPKEIRVQESQFQQMLINLIKNSIEAIDGLAESNGLEAEPRIQVRSYVEEDFLVLDVIDNGIGIEEKSSKIIFTAGYTTKKRGSGLGLHSTANFIIGSGGQIIPLSDGIGKGATMRVKLRLSSVAVGNQSEAGREDPDSSS